MRAMFGRSTEFQLPRANPGEEVYILSFVVTKAGWETLQHRLKLSPSNPVRILTRLIYKAAIDPIKQAQAKWHYLEKNHAKVILYRKQRVAVLGSFNLTKPSLGDNVECFSPVDPADYDQLEKEFKRLWGETKENPIAIIRTRDDLAQAMVTALDDGEEEGLGEDARPCEAELTNDRHEPFAFQKPIIQQVMAWLDTPQDFELGRIVKLPTGAGKTLVAAEVIRGLLEKKPQARILWVCHRVELLRQSTAVIRNQINGAIPEAAWFVPKHIQDESTTREPKQFTLSKDCQMVFCTQQMLRYLLSHNRNNRFDLTVVDECHRFHPRSKWYKKLFTYCSDRSIPRLGLTATPLLPEKRRFSEYWAEAMYGEDISKDRLEREGFLSRFNRNLTKHWPTNYAFVIRRPHPTPESSESDLTTRIGEFNNDDVNKEVAKAWLKYQGQRQRILCFAVTTDHADELKGKYFTSDNCVQVVHSKFETTVNRMRLKWFLEPVSESRMLISVLMLTEGIDLPKTDCLFMVRPTFSPELYQQMIGRGLRGPNVEGTEDCAIVDFTSQYVDQNRRVLPFTQVTTNLQSDGTAERDEVASEEDEEPYDPKTVKDLRRAVDDLRNSRNMSIQDACQELAQNLDYAPSTLANYYHTKSDDYLLEPEYEEVGCMDQSGDNIAEAYHSPGRSAPRNHAHDDRTEAQSPLPGYVTSSKLLDLRAYDHQRFEEIASLTNVASNTLRSYCSDRENFKRWKANNTDKMDRVRAVLTEFLAQHNDAA